MRVIESLKMEKLIQGLLTLGLGKTHQTEWSSSSYPWTATKRLKKRII